MNRMPAEWEEHKATWLAWPKNKETFFSGLENVQAQYLKAIPELAKGEEVHLLVDDDETKNHVLDQLYATENVFFHVIPTVDVWIRDYGPTFLANDRAVKWGFNAWGGKYDDLVKDDGVGEQVARLANAKLARPGMVLEGGSIDVNGKGSCITTDQCLLNKNRNPSMNKKEIEQKLKQFLGVKKIVWLRQGIAGDDTDGHVDDVCRFVSENGVLAAYEDNEDDENFFVLKENYDVLKAEGFNVVKLPVPDPVFLGKTRLPASYANFYVANTCVLLPTFNQRKDKQAIKILQNAFHSRRIISLESNDFVTGLGAIHCATQQQPR